MHFMTQRLSSPIVYQASAGAALATAATSLLQAIQQFRKASDLSSSWTGQSAAPHEQRITQTVDAASRMVQAITRANAISSSAGARMQALKTQNDATVASALSAQFLVLPSGQVVPGPAHYAQAVGPQAAAIMHMYWTIANAYTAQINANVAATGATDVQTAATLATVAIQFISDLIGHKGGGNPAMPSAAGLPAAPAAPGGWTLPPGDNPGSGLAGAGGLGGAGSLGGVGGLGGVPGMGGAAGLGGAGSLGGGNLGGVSGLGGAGGIGGATGIGGAGMVGGVAGRGASPTGGMAGVGPGGARGSGLGGAGMAGRGGAGSSGVIGATPAGGAGGAAGGRTGTAGSGGRSGAGGAMGMGATAGGRGSDDDEQPQADTWLHDDSDPFDPDSDAPGSVLA